MSSISAGTTTTTGYVVSSDTTGALVLKTGASSTTAVTIGSDQSVTFVGSQTLSGGTANGVTYLNGSKVLTSGSALVFDGTNLGIGASTPLKPLDVSFASGARRFLVSYDDSVITIKGAGSTNAPEALRVIGDNIRFNTGLTGSGSEVMRLDSSGNLGLGVTPSAWATVVPAFQIGGAGGYIAAQGSAEVLRIGSNNYFNSGFKYVITGSASRYDQTGGTHSWFTAASGTAGDAITFTQAMTLDASGNLLVGATSQFNSGKQCIAFSGTANYGLSLKDTVDQATARFIGFINGSGTVIGSVDRVTTTNAVIYNTSSDYRLKTVTGAVTGQGARIDALKPIDYLWTEGGQQARGFLAHEFQTVYPSSVTGDKDAVDEQGNPKYQSMQAATSEVIADLVAEIKSLRKRLADAGI